LQLTASELPIVLHPESITQTHHISSLQPAEGRCRFFISIIIVRLVEVAAQVRIVTPDV
jgi:hypothetical protein